MAVLQTEIKTNIKTNPDGENKKKKTEINVAFMQ